MKEVIRIDTQTHTHNRRSRIRFSYSTDTFTPFNLLRSFLPKGNIHYRKYLGCNHLEENKLGNSLMWSMAPAQNFP